MGKRLSHLLPLCHCALLYGPSLSTEVLHPHPLVLCIEVLCQSMPLLLYLLISIVRAVLASAAHILYSESHHAQLSGFLPGLSEILSVYALDQPGSLVVV